MGTKAEMAAGATRRAGASSTCNWKCPWAFVMAASMLLYTAALLGPSSPSSSSCSCRESTQQQEPPSSPWLTTHEIHGKQRLHLPGDQNAQNAQLGHFRGDLRTFDSAWNRLCFAASPPAFQTLRIALFVKKWPVGGVPGGLERHALTLHSVLASRGHRVDVFTVSPPDDPQQEYHFLELQHGLRVHFFPPNSGGNFDPQPAWNKFLDLNFSSTEPFDIVHSESVALPHSRASTLGNIVAASWHGISYEIIHTDLVQDALLRRPNNAGYEPRPAELTRILADRLLRVADEIRFFPNYAHHVGTSDYVSDVLSTIYGLPRGSVHTILNGVDASRFRSDPAAGAAFRLKYGVPTNATLVLGAAGRLVRDKGHPLLFEAISRVLARHEGRVFLLVAGHGPWGDRYRELAPGVKTLGPMDPSQLANFYNAIDVFINPTLRAQGLDHTLLEAMQCGKPLLATKFSSITWSVIVSDELGYTFSPDASSLEAAIETAIADAGRGLLRKKGQACKEYASRMFTAEKMGAAYERLFLCMKNQTFCSYPQPGDCPIEPSRY